MRARSWDGMGVGSVAMVSAGLAIIHQAMKLVGKSPEHERPWTNVPSVALRTRPGDRPVWLRVRADDDELACVRAAAAAACLPVDVVGALLAEWNMCRDAIGQTRIDAILDAAGAAVAEARLAPNSELRAWDQLLAGRGPTPAADELPELCLPQRLAFRLPPVIASGALDLENLPWASLCDRAACRRGMTMETWALREALRTPDHDARA